MNAVYLALIVLVVVVAVVLAHSSTTDRFLPIFTYPEEDEW